LFAVITDVGKAGIFMEVLLFSQENGLWVQWVEALLEGVQERDREVFTALLRPVSFG
jgi:hypothetical protein